MAIREVHLRNIADVLKQLRPGDDEDSVFQREAAEAHIRELLAAPSVPASGGQDGLRGEQMGAFDIWFDAYAKRTPKEHWSLRDAFETGKAFAESRILTATPSSAPASQPDAWTAARHWLLTDDTPNDIALEEGSRRIASLAKLLASRASQPEQPVENIKQRALRVALEIQDQLTADATVDPSKVWWASISFAHSIGPLLEREFAAAPQPEQTVRVPAEQVLETCLQIIMQHASDHPESHIADCVGFIEHDINAALAALAALGSQPPEADLEYVRNLAATDISNEIPLTDAQFNWLQERLRKLVRATSRVESA